MKLRSYPGGVTIKKRREKLGQLQWERLEPAAEAVYLLEPWSDGVAEPVVSVGDFVKVGTLLACDSEGKKGSFSGISGQVIRIGEVTDWRQNVRVGITVQNDGCMEKEPEEWKNVSEGTAEEMLELIKRYGIREFHGGAPLWEKLQLVAPEKIKTILINGVEQESYFSSIHVLLAKEGQVLVRGLELLNRMFPQAELVVAVGADKMDGAIELEKRWNGVERVRLTSIPMKQSAGDPLRLAYQITGVSARNERELTEQEGILCIGADTLWGMAHALMGDGPVLERPLTLGGSCAQRPGVYLVPLGMKLADVMEGAGGYREEPYSIVVGGSFDGSIQKEQETPVTMSTEGILLFSKKEAPMFVPDTCIRCGRCVGVCPAGLVPETLYRFSVKRRPMEFLRWHGDFCDGCGCCSYVCPAKLPLAARIRDMVNEVEHSEGTAGKKGGV